MSESFPIRLIATVVLEVLILLRPMIVSQLQDWPVLRKLRGSLGHGAQIVEGEVVVVFVGQQGHSQMLGVELQGFLGILDQARGKPPLASHMSTTCIYQKKEAKKKRQPQIVLVFETFQKSAILFWSQKKKRFVSFETYFKNKK